MEVVGVAKTPFDSPAILAMLLAMAAWAVLGVVSPPVSAYSPHAPILIIGDSNFTAANGVIGGDGSLGNPFVIEGWEIAAPANAIEIRDTRARFIVQNVSVMPGWYSTGILLANVQNGTVSANNATGGEAGVWVDNSRNVSVERNELPANNRGVLVSWSSNVTVLGNNVNGSRGFGISVQWSAAVEVVGNSVSGALYQGIEGYDSTNLSIRQDNITGARGISANYVTGGLIEDNRVVSGTDHGIQLAVSDRLLVSGNVLEWNLGRGISVASTSNLTIMGNTVANNAGGGIMLGTRAAVLTQNVFTSNSVYLPASDFPGNDHTIASDNLVNGKPLLYHANCAGLTLDGVVVGQLLVANCTDLQVRNLQVFDTDVGIELTYVANASVSSSRLEENSDAGIEAWYSTGVRVEDNTIRSGIAGILVAYTSDFAIRSNFVNDTMYGISAGERNGIVEDNNISADSDALLIAGSRGLIVTNNTVTARNGVRVGDAQDFNVTRNRVSSTGGTGIRMDWGSSGRVVDNCIFWNTAEGALIAGPIPGIVVFRNSFVDNTVHAMDWNSRFWDNGYPDGGNYWSDYPGMDSMSGPNQDLPGSDGFGDTPYAIDADSSDRYPRMTSSCLSPANSVPPKVTATDAPDPANATLEAVWIHATVIDDLGLVSTVWVNITNPVGPHGNFTMNPWFENIWAYAAPYIPVGNYTYTVWASDVSGNWGTYSGTFTILASAPDTTPPAVVNFLLDGRTSVLVPPGAPVVLTATIDDVFNGTSIIVESWYTMNGGSAIPALPRDGAFDSPLEDINATVPTTIPGVHSNCLYARDAPGNVGTGGPCNIVVVNTPPLAEFFVSPGVVGFLGWTFTFDARSSSDGEGAIGYWYWDFGDGGSAEGPIVSHGYGSSGEFVVLLTVVDNNGAMASTSLRITVHDPNVVPTTGWVSIGVVLVAAFSATALVVGFLWRTREASEVSEGSVRGPFSEAAAANRPISHSPEVSGKGPGFFDKG